MTQPTRTSNNDGFGLACKECRYHDDNFEKLGTELYEVGLPRCDSCKPPWRRQQALAAVDRLRTQLTDLARLGSVPELRRKS